jgi:hypothetical protein
MKLLYANTADRKIQREKIDMPDRWPGLQTRPCPLSKKFARVTQKKNCGRAWGEDATEHLNRYF